MTDKCKHDIADIHVVLGDDNEVECIGCGKVWYVYDYVNIATIAENNRVLDEIENEVRFVSDIKEKENLMRIINSLRLKDGGKA